MPAIADVLVLNCGSSSLKYCLYDMPAGEALAAGLIERIGEGAGRHTHHGRGFDGSMATVSRELDTPDHAIAVERVFSALAADGRQSLDAIGHRVVHGGAAFSAPVRLGADSLAKIRATVPLAPLHNPINLTGILAAMTRYPDLPQVAVFDTAFHQTMPERAWRYALPRDWQDRWGVRRYGFHGTSHDYVSRLAAARLGRPREQCNLITLHLGNGASAAAIAGGRCVDTSMGMTPLEGLVMGTRCGDMDPAIPAYMERVVGMTPAEVDDALNRRSGLKALCGEYDLRRILARAGAGDADASLALDIYCYRIRKYVGAYTAALGRVDALVFTGGVGEHAAPVREHICAGLEVLGIRLDPAANAAVAGSEAAIQQAGSAVAILVIPTNEELEIARQTVACLGQAADG
jgi:acetate kinase